MPCAAPLDPLDVEALAAGGEPVIASDAASHVAACATCAQAVVAAGRLAAELESLEGLPLVPADFAQRVMRLRPFSRSERRRLSLWGVPLAVGAALFATGLLLLGAPFLSGGEQAGLSAALLAPLPGVLRALARSAADAARIAPASLDGLASALRQDFALGLVFLMLLLPASFGLRRALLHARGGR